MTRNTTRPLVVALGLILCVASLASAQSNEGITVHGHWVIDIRNPDGSLVSHREFENELNATTASGSSALVGVVGRYYTLRGWAVQIGDANVAGNGPCQSACLILEPTTLVADTPGKVFKNLTVAVPTTNAGASYTYPVGTLSLRGTATAARAGSIDRVATSLEVTGPAFTGFAGVTAKSISSISVVAGQIIQVEVVISFS